MLYPLSWLSEYTTLPSTVVELTDKMTMIGHMLDKHKKEGSEDIIDLELRGNRPDLLGVYGLAREISAAFNVPLKELKRTDLPKANPKNPLVSIKDPELIERFQALTLRVKVKSSPEWLKKRLSYYGIPAINNVVDITNFVMLETGEPLHAFDLHRLTGGKLILRRARQNESMTTIQGTAVHLTPDDLVLADLKQPQGLTMIGSRDSGTTFDSKEILLEAAVYKYANVRRTARRLSVHTEAGTRHEKILDPNNVEWALGRALLLLQELAEAQISSEVFDFYPQKRKSSVISISSSDVERITALKVTMSQMQKILGALGCETISNKGDTLTVAAPTYRTDLEQTADLIEEVARIVGYEKIPARNFNTILENQQRYPSVDFEDAVKNVLVNLGFKETITSAFIPNSDLTLFNQPGQFPPEVKIINPPDPAIATLRPSLVPNLVRTVQKATNYKVDNLAYFEVGKVFFKNKKGEFLEHNRVGLILPAGKLATQQNYSLALANLQSLLFALGVTFKLDRTSDIPCFNSDISAEIQTANKKGLGFVGLLSEELVDKLKLNQQFLIAELDITMLMANSTAKSSPYFLYPSYPGLFEDLTFEVKKDSELGSFVAEVTNISPLIKAVRLINTFGHSRTFRLTYQNATQSVAGSEIKPIRDKILKLAETKYSLKIR